MNWAEFIKYTGIFYFLYYGGNIAIDWLWPERIRLDSEEDRTLHFAEEVQPIVVESPADPVEKIKADSGADEEGQWESDENDTEEFRFTEENINESTGGIFHIRELISEAKAKTFIYTGNLVF